MYQVIIEIQIFRLNHRVLMFRLFILTDLLYKFDNNLVEVKILL